jgi:hypothetical protein
MDYAYLGYRRQHLKPAQAYVWLERFSTGHRIASPKTGHVGTSHDQVADGQKDDRPLWVAEARLVDEECQDLSVEETLIIIFISDL